MGSHRKSTLKLVTRRGITKFRWSRDSMGHRKTSYLVTTPVRRITQQRISLFRHSKTLRKALLKRRRQQLRHPRRVSASRKAMHARESRVLWGSPSARRARSRRNRARRASRRPAMIRGGNGIDESSEMEGGYKLTSPNHRAQISAYQQYRSKVLRRPGSVSAGQWALPKRRSWRFQHFLKKHYSRAKQTYHL